MFFIVMMVFFVIPFILGIVALLYNTSDNFNVFVHTTFLGKTKIYVYNSTSNSDPFTSYIISQPVEDANKIAWRYPSSKIGTVSLSENGNAYYCGSYRWQEIK